MEWRGTVPSMTSNCSPMALSLLILLSRVTELKFAKDQGFCITLSYVAFTDSESTTGGAMRIQNTAFDASRLFADSDDGASASRSVLLLLRAANIQLGTHCESRVYDVGVSRSY